MVLEPADDVEQPAPLARELQGPKRPLRHPPEQAGLSDAGPIHESAKLDQLGLLADERDGILEGIHPRLVRQRVRAGDAVADLAHREAHVRHGTRAWPGPRRRAGSGHLIAEVTMGIVLVGGLMLTLA